MKSKAVQNKTVQKILSFEKEMENLKNEDFAQKTQEFKRCLKKGRKLSSILPEAFALVREATWRVLKMKHYPVQILGGICLFKGGVAELKTGEGKTIVALLPAYLYALEEKGVHVVTVNDYLAKRDAEWMSPVYRLLGLSVGSITSDTNQNARKEAYDCDITYITNNELGFDYLRDHQALYMEQRVQRGFHYAIVDEADSVFIDEARTPLILAYEKNDSVKFQSLCDKFVKTLKKSKKEKEIQAKDLYLGEIPKTDGDYIVNQKNKTVTITENGLAKAEKYFGIKNIGESSNRIYIHYINLALKANYIMKRNVDYIVRKKEVHIVDEFTGRVMPDRRYSDGLHQAIEAKEKVPVKQDTETAASITFQSLFSKYETLSGMTGTIATERKELKEIYGLKVSVIPTNLPVKRKDLEDRLFATKEDKYSAITKEVLEANQKGQPVLVGTASIETSEELSRIFKKAGIIHCVLNAKNNEEEAGIIAKAGCAKAVTIATNMAGRGTDIRLDRKALECGGLYVIGTELYEVRRIDNQLRGRSGRQGDVGKSRFFISLEDRVLSPYFSPQTVAFCKKSADVFGEIKAQTGKRGVRKAQKRKEIENFGFRKRIYEYDKVDNKQMEILYKERDRILKGEITVLSSSTKKNEKEVQIKSVDEKIFLLKTLDRFWITHLRVLEELKQNASFQSLGQINPIPSYKLEAYNLFQQMICEIKESCLRESKEIGHED